MDIDTISAALRAPSASIPAPREPGSSLDEALLVFEQAVRRSVSAQTEAAVSRRPSTLKATLKSASALDRARAHLQAELRLLAAITEQAPANQDRFRLRLAT